MTKKRVEDINNAIRAYNNSFRFGSGEPPEGSIELLSPFEENPLTADIEEMKKEIKELKDLYITAMMFRGMWPFI
jgi:hypothetical protein